MTNKRERQAVILEVVEARPVESQEELRRLLRQRGLNVTQATLSRDLRELRLAKIPTPEGVRYAVADAADEDESRPALEVILPPLFRALDGVSELVVVRTRPGGAQSVASVLDAEGWSEVIGTIAGDDTILLICRSTAARDRVMRRLRRAAAGRRG
jgi:transcriptional regulator of arginine metabolism